MHRSGDAPRGFPTVNPIYHLMRDEAQDKRAIKRIFLCPQCKRTGVRRSVAEKGQLCVMHQIQQTKEQEKNNNAST